MCVRCRCVYVLVSAFPIPEKRTYTYGSRMDNESLRPKKARGTALTCQAFPSSILHIDCLPRRYIQKRYLDKSERNSFVVLCYTTRWNTGNAYIFIVSNMAYKREDNCSGGTDRLSSWNKGAPLIGSLSPSSASLLFGQEMNLNGTADKPAHAYSAVFMLRSQKEADIQLNVYISICVSEWVCACVNMS